MELNAAQPPEVISIPSTATGRGKLMAAKTSAKLGVKRKSSLEPAFNKARDLRYDNLSSVLLKIDEQAHGPAKSQRERTAGEYPTQFAELRAEMASLKAENERMVERLTDELNRLAKRLEELEARAHRPWWGRVFNRSGQAPEPATQPRRQAVARLRALCLD
jgi:septal ring factor EnvC (AmiA/AmiB activator)